MTSSSRSRKVSLGTHISTLLWKNALLKKRHWVATLLEIILPVLFIILMSFLKGLTTSTTIPAGWNLNGESIPLDTKQNGFSSDNLGLSFIRSQYSVGPFLVQETTMSGLLTYLGLRTANEIKKINMTSVDIQQCQYGVGLYGKISTNLSSINAIPTNCRTKTTPYKIAITPDTVFTRQYFYQTMKQWYPQIVLSNTTNATIPAFEDSVMFFNDESALETYITSSEYGKSITNPKVYAAIVFDKYPKDSDIGTYQSIEYSLRFNSTQGRRGSLGTVPRTIGDPPIESPFQRDLETAYYTNYATLGFMTLQTAVTRFVTCLPHWDASTQSTNGTCQQEKAVAVPAPELDAKLYSSITSDFFLNLALPWAYSNNYGKIAQDMGHLNPQEKEKLLFPLRIAPQPYYKTSVGALPIESYLSSTFYDSVKSVFALVFILAYLYAVSRILVVLIQEKETRSREYLKILGVDENAIVGSWYITYIFIFFCASILQALASKGGLFSASDPVLIFLFFFLFSLTVLAYGFLVSTLFSRSRTGAFAGMVFFFFMYFVSSAFTASSSVHAKRAACLLSPVALAFGVQSLATVEATGLGMGFENASTGMENFAFSTALGMFVFDFFLYSILGLYLERVVPSEYGTVEKWYFPISRSYWQRRRPMQQKVRDVEGGDIEATAPLNPNLEVVSGDLQQQEKLGEALVIKNIQKSFPVPGGIKRAVKGVNLTMYKNQITCLLGHNGAGKTTLISMLTGTTPPTGGDAYFHGLCLTQDMPQLRQSLGLCFQHDVLYGEMTVKEHLLLYGRVKGYSGKELNQVVNTKIAEVGLTEKTNVMTASLSGGMKRKLSVAISLLGDSSLVFLDEPTSGMDPYSRRSTWEILLNNRQDRVMVLTTHFMDEADILGDRIAIMSEGELKCCGSSLFLKNRYGAGYNFTLVKKETCVDVALIDFIVGWIPRAKVLSNVGAEIAFQLPLETSSAFPKMFEALDDQLESLGVLSYGISVTTMEEVFIKVAEQGDEGNQHTLQKEAAVATTTSTPIGSSTISDLSNSAMFFIHLSALFLKRFRVAKRDKKVLIFSALLPSALLLTGLALLKSSALTKSDIKVPLVSNQFVSKSDMQAPYYCQQDESQWCSYTMNQLYSGGKTTRFTSSDISSPPYATLDPIVFDETYDSPDFDVNGTTGICLRFSEKMYQRAWGKTDQNMNKASQTPVPHQYGGYIVYGSGKDHVFGYHTMINTTTLHGSVIFKALMDQAFYRFMAMDGDTSSTTMSTLNLTVNTFPLPYTASTKALFGSFLSFTACIFIVIAFAFFPASVVVFLVKEKQPQQNSKHQQLVSGVSVPAFWCANYLWDLIQYSIPCLVAIILIQIFDVSAFTGNGCTSCTSETYGSVVLLFILFGFAIVPFTYVLSYFFQDAASSQTYTIMINFILGVVLMVVSFILDVVSESSADANKVLKYFWRLSPLFNLGTGLLNLSLNEIKAGFGFSTDNVSPFTMDILGWEVLYLACDALLFFTIAIGIDYLLSFPKLKAAVFKDPVLIDPPYKQDEDVEKEAERVLRGDADQDTVVVKQLRKVYKGKKIAVRGISFGLRKGECFGYLGINGAGKTTTMKMMTGDVLPSSGIGRLNGYDILTQQMQVRRLIGYCPQFDALFELLSVREHLELFARIKGVSSAHLQSTVKDLMQQMNLNDFEHKLAGTLSGGNKRKLSVAIAMIGSPPIIFLDEPSTGMDPVSRRFMWNVIANISTQKKESTICLTTHSMEECEALCSRVGIMVGGRLQCLGSVQHLKHRHGNGLMMDIKLYQPTTEQVESRLKECRVDDQIVISKEGLSDACEKLGDRTWMDRIDTKHPTGFTLAHALERDGSIRPTLLCAWWMAEQRYAALHTFLVQCFGDGKVHLIERQNDLCRYKLIGDDTTLKLSNVFRLVESGKVDQFIREYSVSQTTLEQIFNSFAAQQEEEKGVARGMQ